MIGDSNREKRCNKCGKHFPATIEYFYRSNYGRLGLREKCKKCFNKQTKIYKQTEKYKTKAREQKKRHYAVCQSLWDEKENKSMTEKIERRVYPLSEIRINKGVDGNGDKLVGYAAVFNKMSDDLGGFREVIKKGAFKNTIKEADVRALVNHDSNYVLGRSKAGTLKLKEDREGLFMENVPPRTQWADDLMVSVSRGDLDQMSFGFRTISDKWETKNEQDIRTLEEVELLDVSVVTYPAYPDTSVALRSMEQWRETRDGNTSEDEIVIEEEKHEPVVEDDNTDDSGAEQVLKANERKRHSELKRKQMIMEDN